MPMTSHLPPTRNGRRLTDSVKLVLSGGPKTPLDRKESPSRGGVLTFWFLLACSRELAVQVVSRESKH